MLEVLVIRKVASRYFKNGFSGICTLNAGKSSMTVKTVEQIQGTTKEEDAITD